ncbi:MAG: phytanoyl-CoA dioxygenase family protein [Verrucomicrobiales bacterium]|nr:phytanoyl-CoA dioxygenase family protein [Verrucomicrobiales bacterium]
MHADEYDLDRDGFTVRRSVLRQHDIIELRAEADRVASVAGSACVRHIGERSDLLAALGVSPTLAGLIPRGMRPVRSLLFDKTPDENWPVAWHQDTTIAVAEQLEVAGYGPWSFKDGAVHVQPPAGLLAQMISLRVHLDDTPPENGALRVIPGSHRHGRLSLATIQELRHQPEVVCSCAPGDVLLMHPLILHASRRASEPARRRVLHYEYAPGDALDPRLRWAEPDVT